MKQAVTNLIRRYGEPVEIYPRVGQSTICTASVQRPQSDQLINEMDLDAFMVYVAAGDVVQEPLKFDRIRVRGDMRTIDEVQTENYEGQPVVYMMRVRG
jgi:hypothetical protein